MAGQTKRLVGKDGEVYAATKGELVEGNGTTPLSDSYYIVTEIAASSSALPAGLQPGYVFKGSATIIPAEGDKVVPLILTKKCDITNFSVEYSADEIDVTTLCDSERSYRAGFTDATGSLEGVTTINISEYLMSKFIPIVTQTGDTVEVTEIDGDALLMRLVLNKKDGDILSYFAPIAVTSYNIGATIDDAQTYTANFRNTPDDALKPCVLKEVNVSTLNVAKVGNAKVYQTKAGK